MEMMKKSVTNMIKMDVDQMKFAHGARVLLFLLLATLLKTQESFHQLYSNATIFLLKNKNPPKTKAHGDILEK